MSFDLEDGNKVIHDCKIILN